MKNYLNIGDFKELLIKTYQKGFPFILGKLRLSGTRRTQNAFNNAVLVSNWWIIDEVQRRINYKITGDEMMGYEKYIIKNYLESGDGLRMLSIGCGMGNHEIKLAKSGAFKEVTGIDIAEDLIKKANENSKGQACIARFKAADAHTYLKENGPYDIILFHSSLHHFDNIDSFLKNEIIPGLKPGGKMIINEFVGPNRLQWTEDQLEECNRLLLKKIPGKYRKTPFPGISKNWVYRPGLWRMVLSDPSEAPDSASIMDAVHRNFDVVEEKPMGGTILHPLLKDIAHHFAALDHEAKIILKQLMKAEDEFIKNHPSDYMFGVYRVKETV